MITNTDIAKLARVLATKEDVRDLSKRLKQITSGLNSLITTVESLAIKYDKHDLEIMVIKKRLRLV